LSIISAITHGNLVSTMYFYYNTLSHAKKYYIIFTVIKLTLNFDCAVIGAGHAGIEAALATARLGCNTVIFTINLDSIGNCPCNPSIGGTAKGHLVKEIDALGGEMAKTADYCCLQSRMLNKGKGPAVHSLRAQIDRKKYSEIMKYKLEIQENLEIKQAEIINIIKKDFGYFLETRTGIFYFSKTVILATGTYLDGKIFIGEVSFKSGPDGIFPSSFLGESLRKLGIKTKRFKTGTPARALKSSLNFNKMELQEGDEKIIPFSAESKNLKNKISCYITWTNLKTKEIILKNINKSPIYSGKITGTGPRYCPSIEDKIIRFPEKLRHQVFVEPCGLNTEEMYLQGLSSSLPESVQNEFYRTISGFENIKITRPAYAIEYDIADPLQLDASLEFIDFPGLFGAGQFNGSSGYEEAAAQGLIAGINAARKVKNKEKFILDRASSYIGTLIDDMVNKGVNDPYRIMTSRSEYRLILRQDNAEERLISFGREIGLINNTRWENFLKNQELKKIEKARIKNTVLKPDKKLNKILKENFTSEVVSGIKIIELLQRPQVNYKILKPVDFSRPEDIPEEILEQIEIEIKYSGYIKKQNILIDEMRRLENKKIPENINYKNLTGLRLEAVEKLSKIRPGNIGQASRISGVSPADISVLLIIIARAEENLEKFNL